MCGDLGTVDISPADGKTEMNNNSQDELEKELTIGNNSILKSNSTTGAVSPAAPAYSEVATLFQSIIDKKMTQFENKMELLIERKFSELSIKIVEKLNTIENINKCNCQL